MKRVRPSRAIVWSGIGLGALLALTVTLAYAPFGAFNGPIALTIAAVKALVVAAVFMELRERRPLTLVFAGAGVCWLAVLIWLASTDFRMRPGFPPMLSVTSRSISNDVHETVEPGSTGAFAEQGADFARDVSDKTRAAAEETSKTAKEVYSTFTGSAAEFHREWIAMILANTQATFDFARQVLEVKSPSAFVELSAEHARKQFAAIAEQSQRLTGIAQKLTTDLGVPLQAGMKNVLNKAA